MHWVNADRLILESLTLSRQGTTPDAKNPILGEWTAPREVSGAKMEVRYFFGSEGKTLSWRHLPGRTVCTPSKTRRYEWSSLEPRPLRPVPHRWRCADTTQRGQSWRIRMKRY